MPIVYGGTNKLTNIVPICVSCHYKAHNKTNAEGIENAKKNKTVGRKHSVPYEVCYPYIVDYIHGRIGKKEVKAKCGYSEKYKLDKCGYIERYTRDNNIKSFKRLPETKCLYKVFYRKKTIRRRCLERFDRSSTRFFFWRQSASLI